MDTIFDTYRLKTQKQLSQESCSDTVYTFTTSAPDEGAFGVRTKIIIGYWFMLWLKRPESMFCLVSATVASLFTAVQIKCQEEFVACEALKYTSRVGLF